MDLFALLLIYNSTRVSWRPTRHFFWIPDHILAVDAIVTASEWVVAGICLVALGGLALKKLRDTVSR